MGRFLIISLLFFCSSCMLEYNSGIAKLQSEDYKGASEDLSIAYQKDPYNIDVIFARALSRGFYGHYTGAINDLTRAIKLNPNNANFYFYRGYFKSKFGNEKGAIEDYSKTILIYPYYPEAYYNRGIKLLNTGYLSEACQDFQTAVDLGDTLSIRFLNVYCRKEIIQKVE